MFCIAAVQGVGRVGCGAVHLAYGVEVVGFDAIIVDRPPRKGDGVAVQGNHRPVISMAGVIVGSQFMGQVDHEARIAARRSLSEA